MAGAGGGGPEVQAPDRGCPASGSRGARGCGALGLGAARGSGAPAGVAKRRRPSPCLILTAQRHLALVPGPPGPPGPERGHRGTVQPDALPVAAG